MRRASSRVSSLGADRRPHPLATVVWPGVRLSNALVSEECLQLHAVGRGYDEAQDCQFLPNFLAVGLCTSSFAGVTTGADRTTVTPVYVCARCY